LSQVINDEIVFVVDVDIVLSEDIFSKVRKYTRRAYQAYVPILFFLDTLPTKHGESVEGNWNLNAFGLSSFYKSDSPGFDWQRFRGGGEDVDFVIRLKQRPLRVIRRKESGLYHLPPAQANIMYI